MEKIKICFMGVCMALCTSENIQNSKGLVSIMERHQLFIDQKIPPLPLYYTICDFLQTMLKFVGSTLSIRNWTHYSIIDTQKDKYLKKRSISVLKRSPAYDQLNPFTHAPGLHELEENHNLQCLSHGWKYESRLQSRSTLTAIVSACYVTICGGVNFFRQEKNEKLDIFKITAAKF